MRLDLWFLTYVFVGWFILDWVNVCFGLINVWCVVNQATYIYFPLQSKRTCLVKWLTWTGFCNKNSGKCVIYLPQMYIHFDYVLLPIYTHIRVLQEESYSNVHHRVTQRQSKQLAATPLWNPLHRVQPLEHLNGYLCIHCE